MVRYDSASRVRRAAALRLHVERGLKAASRSALGIFPACFHAAGVHDWSTTDAVDTESPPLIYRPVESSGSSQIPAETHTAKHKDRTYSPGNIRGISDLEMSSTLFPHLIK